MKRRGDLDINDGGKEICFHCLLFTVSFGRRPAPEEVARVGVWERKQGWAFNGRPAFVVETAGTAPFASDAVETRQSATSHWPTEG